MADDNNDNNDNEFKEDSTGLQKQTHVTLNNPDHPDIESNDMDAERQREWYKAAMTLLNSEWNRTELVGEFMVAFVREKIEGEEGTLDEVFERIKEA